MTETDAWRLQREAALQEFVMPHRRQEFMDLLRQRRMALSWWKNDGGAGSDPLQCELVSGQVQSAAPPLTNTELVQLQIRVIALENLVITLLAEASDRQLARAREMAAYISPRPGVTRHPLTIHAAAEMMKLVDRAERFRVMPPL